MVPVLPTPPRAVSGGAMLLPHAAILPHFLKETFGTVWSNPLLEMVGGDLGPE
jgi:hypothetical protein